MLHMRRDGRTMGSVNIERDPRIIATLKNGQEITADVANMSCDNFRIYLERLLERDLTDESRKRILLALQTPEPEENEEDWVVVRVGNKRGKKT